MSIQDLNAKITRTRKNNFDTLQAVSLYAHDESETANEKLKSLRVDNTGNLMVNVGDSLTISNVSTEAKQDEIISLLEGQTPAFNRTKAIPVQIMVGDAGGNYDALRANGQDLLVKVDDMDPDCAINSGLSTSAKQDTIISNQTSTQFLLGLLSTKAQQLDIKNSTSNVDTNTSNINDKLVKSVPVVANGNTSATVMACLGSNDGVNYRTFQLDDEGRQQSVIYGEDSSNNIHTIKTSNDGILISEVEHSWDVEELLPSTPLAGGGTALTTGALDLGQGISHEYTDTVFFIENSANQSIDIQPQSSPDGVNWYVSASGVSVSTTQNKSYMCQEQCFKLGHARYMRLRIVNNSASTSTNITVNTGRYK